MSNDANLAASIPKPTWILAVVLFSSPLMLNTADAQFGFGIPGQMTLPQSDFTWTWGNRNARRTGIDDFSVFGTEQGFRCDLTGKFRAGSRLSRMDVREIERDIRASNYFVSAATNAMNDLDARRELDWATLKCEKPKSAEEEPPERGTR